MRIQDFAKVYYSQEESDRDINEWGPVLDLFIKNKANKFRNVDRFEDLYQIGWIGATKAIKTYDITSDNQFTSYLDMCVSNEIKMWYKKVKPRYINKNKEELGMWSFISLNTPINDDESLVLEDCLAGPDSTDIEDFELSDKLNYFMTKVCNKREREILQGMLEGKKQNQIAKDMGICAQSYISTIFKEVKRKYIMMGEY